MLSCPSDECWEAQPAPGSSKAPKGGQPLLRAGRLGRHMVFFGHFAHHYTELMKSPSGPNLTFTQEFFFVIVLAS